MKTLAYIGGCAAASVAGALGYKRVAAIRKGVDCAHDVAVAGVSKAFGAMRKVGEAGSRAVEAHEERHEKTQKRRITVETLQ